MRKIRVIIAISSVITTIFLVFRILENPLFFKDLWQAIQNTSLELSLTFLLVLLLLWGGIELNHRLQKPNTPPTMPGSGLMQSSTKIEMQSDFWHGISTEMVGAVISTILLGMLVLIFQQYQSIQNQKDELIRQMGSDERVWAVEAARQLGSLGWLSDGTLQGAFLSGANLTGAQLNYANLTSAQLGAANLMNTVLVDANLTNAHLARADLRRARLRDADLTDANLVSSDMTDANIVDADLSDAHLVWVILRDAILTGSDLRGTILMGSDLTGATLEGAIFDEKTILPDGVRLDVAPGSYALGVNVNPVYTSESYWTPNTDMSRYTNPIHPDYWNPCVEFEPIPSYCDENP